MELTGPTSEELELHKLYAPLIEQAKSEGMLTVPFFPIMGASKYQSKDVVPFVIGRNPSSDNMSGTLDGKLYEPGCASQIKGIITPQDVVFAAYSPMFGDIETFDLLNDPGKVAYAIRTSSSAFDVAGMRTFHGALVGDNYVGNWRTSSTERDTERNTFVVYNS